MKLVNFPIPQLAPAPGFKPYNITADKLQNGLILRSPNWLGDAVMTLPAAVQLKKWLPKGKKLFVVCPPGLKNFYEALEIFDEVIPLHQAHKAWSEDDILNVRDLHAGAVLMFNNSLRDAIYFTLSKVPLRFGAAARFRGFLLKKAFHFPHRISAKLNHLHHANKYLSMAYALGAPVWNGDMPYFAVHKKLSEMNEEVISATTGKKLMVMAAGAAYGGSKRWPAESFRKVAERWINEKDGIVATLGTAKEAEIAVETLKGLPQDKVFNLAGKTDFPELIHTLKAAAICVANDSGIMHLSAAMGKKGLAIFGPTDPSSTSPVSVYWQYLFAKEPCAPCFKRECPKNNAACMSKVSVAEAWAALEVLTHDC